MDYILKERRLFLFALIISILFLYGSINISYNMYDEGIVVYGASRILKGDMPYRDFWTMYAPGQFYTVAFLFKIFGENLFVTRVYSATINLLIVLLVYFIVRKVSDERLALLSLVLSTLWMGGWGLFYSSPTPSGTFWSLLGIYFVIDFLCTEKISSLFTGGIITGIGAIFRHDIGGYTFIASTIVILFYAYLKISDRSIKDTIKLWGRYLAGTVAGFLPFAIYFLVNVPFGEIIYDLIIFPGRVFLRVRDLPYPGFGFNLYSFLFYFPIIIYLISGIFIVLNIFKLKYFKGNEWVNLLFLILGLFFFNQAWVRSDVPHLLPTIIPAIMLLSSLYKSELIKILGRGEIIIKILLLLMGFILTLALYLNALKGLVIAVYALPLVLGTVISLIIYIPVQFRRFYRDIPAKATLQVVSLVLSVFVIFSCFRDFKGVSIQRIFSFKIPGLVTSQFERAKGIYVFQGQETYLEPAIKIVRANTKPDELIFVGNSRHDRIFINDVMFYFLCERHSATKYHELHPGLANTRKVQLEIIDELKRNNVKIIVLWNGAENVVEPNESSVSTGVNDLDDFIRLNYATIMYLGPYRILQRITGGEIG